MSLRPGSRLGPFEIVSAIGAGGMGEVYCATDTNLGRHVAIKVLPEAFANDPERVARFEREAKTLASLNHPNIAIIHGVEKAEGTYALVMELVEGEDLSQRIARGPIPVDESLPIAKQIAHALEAAHEQGIIHRDLKPANIKVRPDGKVKVLDFGLAKLAEPSAVTSGSSSPLTSSPTFTSPAMMTAVGVLLGTAAYMSPEQAKGRLADKRSDIWAFGCVVYEMLTGRRPFVPERDGDGASSEMAGADVLETLAAVIRGQVDWTALPSSVPTSWRVLLRRCLEKERRKRIGDMAAALVLIEEADALAATVTPDATRVVAPAPSVWRRALPVAAALLVGGVLVGLVAWMLRPPLRTAPVARFAFDLPESHDYRGTGRAIMAVSSDGRAVVYNTTTGLYLRMMDQLETRLIAQTEPNLTSPFFSPDGQWVGYFDTAAGQLKRVAITGGTPVVIASAVTNPFGASWGTDGTILFGQPAGVMRVPAAGGTPELAIKAGKGEQVYGPQRLAGGGDAVLFSVTTAAGPTRWDQADVVVQSLRTGQRTVVLRGGSEAKYLLSGHLVYAIGTTLFAVAFDINRLTVSGGAVPVVENVSRATAAAMATGAANYGVSDDGTLVYATGSAAGFGSFGTLVWVDRKGKAEPVSTRQADYQSPRISPDGTRIAVSMAGTDGNRDIWVVETARSTYTRLTTDPGTDTHPVWTPDGRRIAYASGGVGANAIYWRAADGSGSQEVLTKATTNQGATSWLPDASTLVFYDVGGSYDLFTLKPGASAVRLSETPFREQGPVFSPDGHWLAYSSDETGQAEIYITPYPGPGGKTAVSTSGGRSPRWSSNGRELFFRNGRQMLVASIELGSPLRVGSPQVLFEGNYAQETTASGAHNYDLTNDGQRFLLIAPVSPRGAEEERRRFVVVQHFDDELKRLVQTK
jgi:eukaryotic-like serine/threonine-protein kinase